MGKETGEPSLRGLSATKELLKAYPPKCGVYDFDLGLKTVQNHLSKAQGSATGTHLSGEVLILNHSSFEANVTFFQGMTPVLQSCGALFQIINPQSYARCRALYDKIGQRSILCALRTTRRACWQMTTAFINTTDSPCMKLRNSVHRDGWVAQACFGDFTGGAMQVPELGIKFEFQPGDVVFMRPALLECRVADFIGKRYGLVLYNSKLIEDFETSDKDTTEREGQGKRKRSEENIGENSL